jgi:chloramphenicol 3-O-phosphotransferase
VVTQEPYGQQTLDQGRACLLITGAPGAGKSTVSGLVAAALSRSALIDAYFVSRLVASGYVWPLGEPADEAARQVRLLNTNLCALAANFADAGFTPVIDVVLPDGEQLEDFRRALTPHRLLLVVLDPGADVCRLRNENRPPQDQFFFDGYDELRTSMRQGFADVGWWFDTSGLTPQQTAQRILDEGPVRAVVNTWPGVASAGRRR